MNAIANQWSDEQLVAYADGELPAAEVRALEAAIELDGGLAQRAALMLETRELSRQVFGAQLDQTPVPAALRASVEAMVAQDRVARAREQYAQRAAAAAPHAPWWRALAERLGGYALPAGAMASVLFGALGYMLGSAQLGTTPGAPTLLATVGAPAAPALAGQLDRLASGQQAGQAPVVAMVASYRDSAGTLCRDFSVEPADAPRVEAVACRAGAGQWRIRFAAMAADGQGGFTPASSDSALDSYLAGIGAGKPLTPAEERAALAQR